MKYKILSHTSKIELAKIVQEYLEKGWQLQGGVAITTNSENDIAFAQSIIKH